MKLTCILWLCLIINSICGQGIAFDSSNEFSAAFATWTDFQTRHIISNDQGSAANWNAYFRLHIPSQYGNKGVNSFIVNTVSSIANNFPLGVPKYIGGTTNNSYWSSTEQHIFVLTLSGPPPQNNPTYNVYDCGQKYYVAGLDTTTRLPIHYQGHSTTQGPKIDQITAGCIIVTKSDLFCGVDEVIGRPTQCIVVMVSGILLGLVIVAFVAIAVFKKCKGLRFRSKVPTNEYSPLFSNNGGNRDGNQYMSGYN